MSKVQEGQGLGSWASLLATYKPRWSFSFLGTGFVLVWIQCILYARYIWVDSGLTTVAINFSRCACIVVLGAVALHKVFSSRTETMLGWASVALMTLGSLLFFVQALSPWLPFTTVAAICSGVGLAWGGGMWMKVYERLDIREALLHTFSSLSLSTLIGVFIAFVSEYIAFFISMLLPMMTFVMYKRATKVLDGRQSAGIALPPPRDDVYAEEPRRTSVRLALGIALFSFVMGASRGFPFGTSIELVPVSQLVQHLGVAAIGLGIIWWTLVRGRRFRFSALWQAQLAALAVGVMLLSTLDPLAGQIGATLIAITNLFQVAFLWFVSYDVARHRALPSYVVLGFFWIFHLFFRESGRLVMWWIGSSGGIEMMLVIAVMICLIAVSVGFLLTDALPGKRPLFAELCQCAKAAALDACEQEVAPGEHVENASHRQESLHERFGLTQRETEVALLLAEGRSSTYIAGELYLSDNTVRSYVKNIYQKLGVHSKQDLIDFVKEL
ncbi:MAG: LuxR C-terminal-related transcriptional regulator [Gordonibacter sp.]